MYIISSCILFCFHFKGSWADDEREGRGKLTYYTGEKYEGNWVADKKGRMILKYFMSETLQHFCWEGWAYLPLLLERLC